MVQQPEHPRNNLVDELQRYFDETPREKVLDDWRMTADFDSVGITCDEFIKQSEEFLEDFDGFSSEPPKASFDDKKKALISWIRNMDECDLDVLIKDFDIELI
jgi:hypothetical protein